MWSSGLGLWKPASVPHAIWCDLSFLLNQRPLVIFLGYLTLYFETAFVILIWFPRLRLPLFVIGIGLHLGTAIVFPLPWFGLVMCALYIPLLPRWVLAHFFRNRRGENAAAAAATAEGTGVAGGWRRTALMGGVTLLVAAQLTLMLNHPSVRSLAEKTQRLEAWQSFHDHCYLETVKWSKPLVGITPHAVFASGLFERKNWLVSVVYRDPDGRDVPLPFCRENGLAHPLNSGRVWVHWVFHDGPFIGFGKSFDQLIEKMAAHWSARNGWDSNTAKYVIRVKRVDQAPNHWERDFLRHQLDRPWIEVGTARWENGQFRCSIQLPGLTELSKLETTR